MDPALFTHIDLYCERHGPGLWAEPVNALTNLAFIAAGQWGLREVRRRGTGAAAVVLCWWVIAIGIGSGLFHTFANHLTIWADIVPIATFTLASTLFALRRFARFAWTPALVIFVGFYAAAGLVTLSVPDWLRIASNGTTGYLPAFLAMLFFGGISLARGSPAGWYLIAAGVIFVFSATGRMIDLWACDVLPIGTHFLWHTLNGLMLGVVLTAVARYGAPLPQTAPPPAQLAAAAGRGR